MKCFCCVQPPSSSAEAPSHQEAEPPTARIQKDKVERFVHTCDFLPFDVRVAFVGCKRLLLVCSGFWCPRRHPHFWSLLPFHAKGRGMLPLLLQKIQSVCPAKLRQWVRFSRLPHFVEDSVHFLVRCIKCIPPAEQWGRSGTFRNLSLVEPTDLLFLYMFSVFPFVFSLNMRGRTCLLWMCDLLPFHLISSLPRLWIAGTLNSR